MRKGTIFILAAAVLLSALPLEAQQPCLNLPVVINTSEDKLMLAVNGSSSPQEQIQALSQYAQANPDSKFLPCVNEYLTMAYLKAQDYDQAIAAGERDLAANYLDLNLILNLLKAYVASGKAGDQAFTLIMATPQQVKTEIAPATAMNATAEQSEKAKQAATEQGQEFVAYSEYAFFQLLPRVTDATKRIQYLDSFRKAFPNSSSQNQEDVQYFIAYQMANQPDQIYQYGEKAAAADPSNAATLNLVADGYASHQAHLEKASGYAKKALDLASHMQKPEGMADDQFKTFHDTQVGLAHSTLGYVELQEGQRSHRVEGAIRELKAATDLLAGNANLQARALYYLGLAYELRYPAEHHLAAEALSKAVALESPWKAPAQDLLSKVRRAESR